MALSFLQCYAVILVLAVFQPAYLQSLTSEMGEETLQVNRVRREAAVGIVDPKTLTINPTPCPDGQDFCETADDYPTSHINEMIKKQPKFILDHFYTETEDYDVNKFNPSIAGETPLCAASNTVVYPQKGRARDGTYEFIVNDNDYKQGVRVEACLSQSNNNQCNIPGSLSLGYTSYCVQKHIQRTMVVVDKSSPGLSGFLTKPFEFPSCCSCVVVMNSNAERFGISPVGSGPINTTAANTRT